MTRAFADIDLGAIRANTAHLQALAGPAQLCAVVKANGYGHGAVRCAQAAQAAGASWLATAQAGEGAELRLAGLEGPILLLSEPLPSEDDVVFSADLAVVVYRAEAIDRLNRAAIARRRRLAVHLKIDTGMHRLGAPPEQALELAAAIQASEGLQFEGFMTHLAVADEPVRPETALQLERFAAALAELDKAGLRPPLVHAANSAGLIVHPAARFDLVRAGIALYGIAPGPGLGAGLQAALRLSAPVTYVRSVGAGEGVSYGLRGHTTRPTVLATLAIGYADGVRRSLGLNGGEVLINGQRCPMIGVVTMDQLVVDVGDAGTVAVGDEAVLLGEQGGDRIDPQEWAERLDTIAYEIVTGLGARVERRYHG